MDAPQSAELSRAMLEMFLAAPAPAPELSEVSDISVSGDASACMSS